MSMCSDERLRILEEKEARRKASTDKSKKRPEYKEKIKMYNKKYYEQRKLKANIHNNKDNFIENNNENLFQG